MSNWRHTYRLFGIFFGGIFLFLWAIYPYLQAEILTSLYVSRLNVNIICQKSDQKSNIILKNVKLISYNPERNEAVLDCLYNDSDQNIRVRLAFRLNNWEVVFITLLNKPRSFYWPIYS